MARRIRKEETPITRASPENRKAIFSITTQLQDGRRLYAPMAWLLKDLPDQYLTGHGGAFRFTQTDFSPPEPLTLSPTDIARPPSNFQGDAERKIPARGMSTKI
jgi:hypothetical protein